MRGVHGIAVRFERSARGIEPVRGPGQIARNQRNFRFRDDAARPRHGLARAKCTRRRAQQFARARMLAQLGQCDAAQCETRCVFAQRYQLQCADGVAGSEHPCGRGDQ